MTPSAGSRPVSRTSCLLVLAVWLVATTLACLALTLAMRGELAWRRGQFVEDRLWLVNEPDARGLGYSMARVISNQTPVDGPLCVRTRVYFVLWKGSSETTMYCECYAVGGAGGYELTGSCP